MKLKATTLALFAAGLLAGLTLTAPATGADPPATTTTTLTVYGSASGAIAALSANSITVNDLTCARSSSSPSLDGYKIGDQVGLGCANGVAIVIVDKRTPAPVTIHHPEGAVVEEVRLGLGDIRGVPRWLMRPLARSRPLDRA